MRKTDYQATFKRYELKYMLHADDKNHIMHEMQKYVSPDIYGRTTIRNIYFDTPDFRIIRRSLEKPVYKEKLRLRSYKQLEDTDDVFVELKKKYDSVVYKRRLTMNISAVEKTLMLGEKLPDDSQIAREIEYFRSFYPGLMPKVFISYEREAFLADDGSDLRITFDENILYRTDGLSLKEEVWGEKILKDGDTLLEIKTSRPLPLWLTATLTELKVFRTPFSKYGEAYMRTKANGGF